MTEESWPEVTITICLRSFTASGLEKEIDLRIHQFWLAPDPYAMKSSPSLDRTV
ncbi:hypothetical protein O77CONTIG1_00865 [Leptolyngbya sp. O-77]|nr:hypothetical protein O77CONTIG1_00865 [Leptolyngbya sp. O-77]